jgi:drug/metabolite transporter (DMT)-like permease
MNSSPDEPPSRRTGLRALIDEPRFLVVLPGLFWAGNSIVARSIAGDIPPVGLAFWRWAVAALLILPIAWPHLRRDLPVMRQHWPIMLVLTALGVAIYNTLLYIGAQTTTALNLVMLQTTMPLVVFIASFFIFGQKVTRVQGAAIAISLLGALTLISHGDPAVLTELQFKRGDLWMLVAIVCYAFYTALLRLRPQVHGLSFAYATFALGALLLLPFYIAETLLGRPMPVTMTSMLAVAYVAFFASVLAYLAFNRIVELLGANTAGMVVHLVPVFGTILAVLLLGESLHLYHGVGIALIATGIWLATRRAPA